MRQMFWTAEISPRKFPPRHWDVAFKKMLCKKSGKLVIKKSFACRWIVDIEKRAKIKTCLDIKMSHLHGFCLVRLGRTDFKMRSGFTETITKLWQMPSDVLQCCIRWLGPVETRTSSADDQRMSFLRVLQSISVKSAGKVWTFPSWKPRVVHRGELIPMKRHCDSTLNVASLVGGCFQMFQFFFWIFIPIPGGFMIQFDFCIFLKWVETPQLGSLVCLDPGFLGVPAFLGMCNESRARFYGDP